jgi:hypothetical protein
METSPSPCLDIYLSLEYYPDFAPTVLNFVVDASNDLINVYSRYRYELRAALKLGISWAYISIEIMPSL